MKTFTALASSLVFCYTIRGQTQISGTNSSATTTNSNDQDLQNLFSTNKIYPEPANLAQATDNTCTPVQLQFISRHGTRNPTEGSFAKMQAFEQFLKNQTVSNEFLANFQLPFKANDVELLLPRGVEELKGMGQRVRQRHPNFKFDPSTTTARSTFKERTQQSGNAFLQGLGLDKKLTVGVKGQDSLLRFFDSCNKYIKEHPDGQDVKEQTEFEDTVFPGILKEVAASSQLQGLDNTQVKQMKSLCYAQTMIDPNVVGGGMCDFFTNDNLKDLQYDKDLDKFYTFYEGGTVKGMTCDLMKTLMNNMKSMAEGSSSAKAAVPGVAPATALFFGHAETMIPVSSAFGLFEDDFKLKADTPQAERAKRQFVTSKVTPFATNIWLELYNCGGNDFKVRMLFNEVPIKMPGCDDIMCDLETVLDNNKDFLTCDFDKVCDN